MKAAQVLKIFSGSSSNYMSSYCFKRTSKLQVRYSATLGFVNYKNFVPVAIKIRNLGLGPTSKEFNETTGKSGPITKAHATELVRHLNDDERKVLFTAIEEYESNKLREEYEDRLAFQTWRSKLGRPCKVPTLGDVDPTGTYCPMPEDWLKKKYGIAQKGITNYEAETVPKPTTKELLHLSFTNSIPFIGFGFLDNFIMIIAGDSIESSLSAYITLSTMAAAALGNTFSDVIGIGSSYYVENAAAKLGFGKPRLSPVQLDMNISRRYCNMGRVLGITLGCVLGMTPLLFRDDDNKTKDDKDKKQADKKDDKPK